MPQESTNPVYFYLSTLDVSGHDVLLDVVRASLSVKVQA